MLEEIRVKVMNRLDQFNKFPETWLTNISPMALRVLEKNIAKSMKCHIQFNGERGLEISDESYVHTVDMRSRTCSCKSWMLKGIPSPHAIDVILYKNWEPNDYVDDCYSKETYLRNYCHYLQPVTNMKMWPDSINPHVEPPVVKSMTGRPRKVRNKKCWETKKSGKLPRKGVYMTCSICHGKNHNKRSCPLKDSVAAGPSNEAGTSRAIPKPRGRPRKTPTTTTEAPARGRGRTCEPIATSTIGRERDTSPDTAPARGRGICIGRADTTPIRADTHLQGEDA